MTYLGIDYGEKHVGLALSQASLAEPLSSVDNDKAVQLIEQLIKEHQIDALVVGDCPEDFLNRLSNLGLPVHTMDETLTTRDAVQSLLHTSRSRRKNMEHAVAAAIILQSWLDFQAPTS